MKQVTCELINLNVIRSLWLCSSVKMKGPHLSHAYATCVVLHGPQDIV